MFSQNLFPIFFLIYRLYFKPNTWKHEQILKPLPLTLNPQGNSLLLAVTTKALVWETPPARISPFPPSLPPLHPFPSIQAASCGGGGAVRARGKWHSALAAPSTCDSVSGRFGRSVTSPVPFRDRSSTECCSRGFQAYPRRLVEF